MQILIADDHELVRNGLRTVLEMQPGWKVCGEAVNGRQAVELARDLRPDVIVMDVTMPELNGLEATRQICKAFPEAEVLILTMHESEQLVSEVDTFAVPPPVITGISRDATHSTVRWTSVSNATYVLSQSSDFSAWRDVAAGIYGEAGIASQGARTEYTVPTASENSFFAVKTRGYTRKLIGVAPQFVERVLSYTPMIPGQDGLHFLFNEVDDCEAGTWKLGKLEYATGHFGAPVTVITNVAPAHGRLAWGPDIPYVAWQDITDLKLHIKRIAAL